MKGCVSTTKIELYFVAIALSDLVFYSVESMKPYLFDAYLKNDRLRRKTCEDVS